MPSSSHHPAGPSTNDVVALLAAATDRNSSLTWATRVSSARSGKPAWTGSMETRDQASAADVLVKEFSKETRG